MLGFSIQWARSENVLCVCVFFSFFPFFKIILCSLIFMSIIIYTTHLHHQCGDNLLQLTFPCITSPLCHENIHVACVMTGSAALRAEKRKHNTNDEKCRELGWVSIPLVVESYGCWGTEAQRFFSRLSGQLASRFNQPWLVVCYPGNRDLWCMEK